MAKRKMDNMLALAVLVLLWERPMHPYEMAQVLRERGKDMSINIKWGSLYTVIRSLERNGFIEVTRTFREGRRPERTVYAITEEGREEMRAWLRELIAVPAKEYPRFEGALSLAGALPPDEVISLLEERVRRLDGEIAEINAQLAAAGEHVARIFLIEGEYVVAMRHAEAEWIRSLLSEIEAGTLEGLDLWRSFHDQEEGGEMAEQ